MTGLTPEHEHALEVAHRLVDAGIPIVVGPRHGRKDGIRATWKNLKPSRAVVDRWVPGLLMAAVMGHGLDLVDVDLGGEESYDQLVRDGLMPTVYAEARTPSGGRHYFVASMGVGVCDDFMPGIDIKAGSGKDDHGLAFIAPSERLAKPDYVERRSYVWTVEPA